MTDPINPYAAPSSEPTGEPPPDAAQNQTPCERSGVRSIVVAWEKRRFGFNAALAALALLLVPFLLAGVVRLPLTAEDLEDIAEVLGVVLLFLVLANVCFTACPLIEGCLTWIVGPRRWLRGWYFTLAVSALAVAGAIWVLLSL